MELIMTATQKKKVWSHLLPKKHVVEEAAFLFAVEDSPGRWRCKEFWLLQANDLSYQSNCHIELADATRGKLIKRAHDLGACLVELHSHLGPWPAGFSTSDLSGFDEWVPHVRWRLKGRPYTAIVVTRSDFDALVWEADTPERLASVTVGKQVLRPNGRSPLRWSFVSEEGEPSE